jgi:hypothetical protein
VAIKKITNYSHYILMVILSSYLLLLWMYFKYNTLHINAFKILLWFVIIPLLLFSAVILIRWRQKKQQNKIKNPPNISGEKSKAIQPEAYQLFIYSSISLPEGDSWSEIKDNHDDLTILSENLTFFDNLPLLIKPIARVTNASALLQSHASHQQYDEDGFTADGFDNESFDNQSFENDYFENKSVEDIDTLTLRLYALILEQLVLSDEVLTVIGQYFTTVQQKNTYEPNSAINIHPEWQQYCIASANEDNADAMDNAPMIELSQLAVYLCLPMLADTAFIIDALKQQLALYGIAEHFIIIKTVTADDSAADSYQPIAFINQQLIGLSKALTPEVCLFIGVDSQINEQWLESKLYAEATPTVVPTEASSLLIFCNQAAEDLLNLASANTVAKIGFLLTETTDSVANSSNKTIDTNNRRHYRDNLRKIKQLLIDNDFVLTPQDNSQAANSPPAKTLEKQSLKPSAKKTTITDTLDEANITLFSDINLVNQPNESVLFMTFIDDLTAQGALVNEHFLGHYMPLSLYLKPFISLALLVDFTNNNQQQSDTDFLITQHKHCCVLWLSDPSKAS